MNKSVFLACVLLFVTSNAFAISDEKLAQTCFAKGVEKVLVQAQAWDCAASAEQVEVLEVDNRWYNPSKYVWYQVVTPCSNGYDRVTKLVQYYNGKCL